MNVGFLGIPREDQEQMSAWSDEMWVAGDPECATTACVGYLADLLDPKREQPGDDAQSDLVTTCDADGLLTEEQALAGASHLFFGGYETVAARISHGVLALLSHPGRTRC